VATNYNPNATIDDGSCTYESSAPDWEIDYSQYQFNGALTSTVQIDGLPVGSESDILAGFVGSEIRGVVHGIHFPLSDKYIYSLYLYSNSTSGDSITFQFYDESVGLIIPLLNKIEFESDMILGTPLDPVILNGNSSVDTYFSFTQSSLQGFYIIQFAEINGVSLTDEDWIGAFNQSICIGSTTWAGEYTTVPAMGDDGTSFTTGYIVDGEIPQFKIYDASENRYYNALSEGYVDPMEWENNAIINIESLNAETE